MPTQNTRHERLHRTLKQDAATPPAIDLVGQQKRFQEFRQVYNFERPHEALDLATPASVYVPSPRPLPKTSGPMEYPWSDPGERRLYWFGLTSGRYWVETPAGEILRYADEFRNRQGYPYMYVDY